MCFAKAQVKILTKMGKYAENKHDLFSKASTTHFLFLCFAISSVR